MVSYRMMTAEDLERVLSLPLRDADVFEANALSGYSPLKAIALSLVRSEIVWVVLIDSEIEGIFGLSWLGEGVASPWFLGTDVINEHSFQFARHSKRILNLMLEQAPVLINFICSENAASIAWLEWLGFQVERVPLFIDKHQDPNVPFYRFIRWKDKIETLGRD